MKTHTLGQHSVRFTCALIVFAALTQTASAVEFSMFGDAVYSTHSHEKGFSIGSIDLSAEQTVSDSTKIATEIVIEDGEHGIEVDLERYSISRTLGESHEITLGRFVKPLGFWNHNFFHGSLSQDTITRPFFFEYAEQHEGIFPSHLVGALFSGEAGNFTYQFAMANSNGIDMHGGEEGDHFELRSLNTGDPSGDKSMVLRGTWQVINSLEIGFMYLSNKTVQTSDEVAHVDPDDDLSPFISTTEHGDTLFDQTVFGLDFNFTWNSFYAFGEFYTLSMKDNQGLLNSRTGSYSANAHYFQLGYKFTDSTSLAFRHASLTFPQGNTYLELLELPQEARNILALHYRIEDSNSFRLEFSSEDRKGDNPEKLSAITVQWFFFLL